MPLTPGAEVAGYRIVEQAGRGGMATVYKAYQPTLSRYVAIKVLPPSMASGGDFDERFRNEAVRLAALRHPSIPAVFDYGTADGVTYIASDFIDGGTLSDQLGSPLPLDYTTSVLAPIASALDYAHSRGVIHRDIKPSNILLTRDARPMLTDFGIARMLTPDVSMTQTGMILGTPQYMAPEQGAGETSAAADIYSLAVVAYHMLTGRVPFDAATPMAVILAHQQEPLPLPRTINPAMSEAVEGALLKGLSRDPGARYPSAGALIRALTEAGNVTSAVAPPPPAPLAEPRPAEPLAAPLLPAPRRSRRPALLAAVLVLALLAAGGAGGWYLTHRSTVSPAAVAAPVAPHPARWQQWIHMTGVVDIRARSDGRLLAAANGGLELLGRDGAFGAYSPAYKVDPSGEAYIAVSPGIAMAQPACTFPIDQTYALRLQAPLGITQVDVAGKVSNFVTIAGIDGLSAIGFDTGGRFGHRLLVAGTHSGATVLVAIDCTGHTTTITSQAPRIEGGLAVAPPAFRGYAGDVVAADEITGRIIAIAPDGTSTVVANSGVPVGQDLGIESPGFVPPFFLQKNGFAYVADRATAKNAHPGTDSVLRLSAAELAAAGVQTGDLLVVTEGGSLTIDVRCATTCTVRNVASGPDVAHGEGSLTFTVG